MCLSCLFSALEAVDPDKVYVLGGLVDESIQKVSNINFTMNPFPQDCFHLTSSVPPSAPQLHQSGRGRSVTLRIEHQSDLFPSNVYFYGRLTYMIIFEFYYFVSNRDTDPKVRRPTGDSPELPDQRLRA